MDALVEVLLSKNQQAVRQLKFIINRGVEADLYTAQGFEALSAGLTGAVNGAWQVPDADAGEGVAGIHRQEQPLAAASGAGAGVLVRPGLYRRLTLNVRVTCPRCSPLVANSVSL